MSSIFQQWWHKYNEIKSVAAETRCREADCVCTVTTLSSRTSSAGPQLVWQQMTRQCHVVRDSSATGHRRQCCHTSVSVKLPCRSLTDRHNIMLTYDTDSRQKISQNQGKTVQFIETIHLPSAVATISVAETSRMIIDGPCTIYLFYLAQWHCFLNILFHNRMV